VFKHPFTLGTAIKIAEIFLGPIFFTRVGGYLPKSVSERWGFTTAGRIVNSLPPKYRRGTTQMCEIGSQKKCGLAK